jgi:hypothetical protein
MNAPLKEPVKGKIMNTKICHPERSVRIQDYIVFKIYSMDFAFIEEDYDSKSESVDKRKKKSMFKKVRTYNPGSSRYAQDDRADYSVEGTC